MCSGEDAGVTQAGHILLTAIFVATDIQAKSVIFPILMNFGVGIPGAAFEPPSLRARGSLPQIQYD